MKEARSKRESLRIVLDAEAVQAYEQMVEVLKQESAHVKVRPSIFVGHILKKYLTDHLKKDLSALVAAFFDAEAFYEEEIKQAKSEGGSFEQAMRAALKKIDRIKKESVVPRRSQCRSEVNGELSQEKLE